MKKLFFLTFLLTFFSFYGQNKLPNVSLKDIQGKTIFTKNFNEKDKLYIISFWATWCAPCIHELDSFNDLYENWKSKLNVEIAAISIDDSRTIKRVKPLVNGKGWEFNVLLDVNQDLKRALGISNVPYLVVVKNGKIIHSQSGFSPGSEEELFHQLEKM